MKELSIEENAKRYDEALERAKALYENANGMILKKWVEQVFPELKDSEDEKIRKAIKKALQVRCDGSRIISDEPVTLEEALAWLEKQGEQKPANKTEPKFHKGEWIVWQGKCYKVNYNGCGYELVDQNGLSTSLEYGTVDEKAHIYDITKDAKDGDVLATLDYILIFKELLKDDGGISYCHYDFGAGNPQFIWFEDKNWYFGKEAIIHPATKEQRELLFQKMKEAGYEWDATKKELKKIEQKPAWSEEDNEMLNSIIEEVRYIGDFPDYPTKEENKLYDECLAKVEWLKSLKNRVQPQLKQEWSNWDKTIIESIEALCDEKIESVVFQDAKEHVNDIKDWLKSLKPWSQWKPSDKQMEALIDINLTGGISYSGQEQELINLYNDLKKLKG